MHNESVRRVSYEGAVLLELALRNATGFFGMTGGEAFPMVALEGFRLGTGGLGLSTVEAGRVAVIDGARVGEL